MARSDNLKLGNWMKNKYGNLGNQWKTCRVYSTNGPDVMLNEVHVLLERPAKANGRKTAGLVEYVQQYLEMANKYILKRYLGQDGSGKLKLLKTSTRYTNGQIYEVRCTYLHVYSTLHYKLLYLRSVHSRLLQYTHNSILYEGNRTQAFDRSSNALLKFDFNLLVSFNQETY